MIKERIENIIIFLSITIIVFSFIIINPLNNLDEIWNYNAARVVSEGLIPYKDISMITTPLFQMFIGLLLKLTINELIIYRIFDSILWAGIIFIIYKILKATIKEENICLIFTSLIGILYRELFALDYNSTVIFIALLILYKELKNINSNNDTYNIKYDFSIGVLAGLSICTKHSIGGIISFAIILYKLLKLTNKKNFKNCIKSILIRITGIIIPVVIMFIYLLSTKSFNEFINYAILGINTFDNKVKYINLITSERKYNNKNFSNNKSNNINYLLNIFNCT